MNILALDASTEFLSLAVTDGGNVYQYNCFAGQAASQLVLPEIHKLLECAELELTDLDGIAFGAGPGSFTGVRVACGVAQGLAFGAGIPITGINVLMAMAQASGAQRVIVASDARMKEVYHAVYEKRDDAWQEVQPAGVYKPIDVPDVDGNNWYGVGTAWKVYPDVLAQRYQEKIIKTLPDMTPQADAIIDLAKPIFESGLGTDASNARPIYIRNRVALTAKEREQGHRL